MTAIAKSAKTHPAAKNVVAAKNVPYATYTFSFTALSSFYT